MISIKRGECRKKLSLHSLSRLPINHQTYFKELEGESDRACALIAGAVISDGLQDLLKHYFIKLKESDINHLFHDHGAPLGDFASQTDISFALGLITPQERLVADVIRRIRNLYAHTLAQIDFSHEVIATELSKVSVNGSLENAKPKPAFIGMSMVLYMNLIARSIYLAKQRSLTIPLPIYKLAMEKSVSGAGMVAPN